MSKVRYKVQSGGASIDLDGQALDMFKELVDMVAPNTRRELEAYVIDLEKHARRNWIIWEKDSQRSIDRFFQVLYVTPDFKIIAGVGNSAPYAFAIKVGRDSKTKIKEGKTLAIEVLWKPAQKRIDRLIDIIGNELVNTAKRL